jgi:hypothetical protein
MRCQGTGKAWPGRTVNNSQADVRTNVSELRRTHIIVYSVQALLQPLVRITHGATRRKPRSCQLPSSGMPCLQLRLQLGGCFQLHPFVKDCKILTCADLSAMVQSVRMCKFAATMNSWWRQYQASITVCVSQRRKFDPVFFIPFCDCQQGPLLSGHRKGGGVPKSPRSHHTFETGMQQHSFKRPKDFRKRNERIRTCSC